MVYRNLQVAQARTKVDDRTFYCSYRPSEGILDRVGVPQEEEGSGTLVFW